MNDAELDRLLNTWEAPVPSQSLRQGLRAQFPRAERPRFARPLRWVLAIAIATAALAIGMEQSGGNSDFRIVRVVNRLYDEFVSMLDAWRASSVVARIRQSDPKVYVDGQLAGLLKYGHAHTMDVQVPGEGLYSIISYPLPANNAIGRSTGWVQAGYIRGNIVEFQAGSKRVRIECSKPIVDSERPVLALRRRSE